MKLEEWSEFPDEILQLIKERQFEQTGLRDLTLFPYPCANKFDKGFTWETTVEGDSFWDNIITHKNFEEFYKLYPQGPKIHELWI